MNEPTPNGRSMEEDARHIPRRAIHARFAALGGVERELPERTPMRPPPEFG
ncbi:MAG: hypothetical protein OYH76_01070 [Defluviicoccus sp.]|nr:hypothetical protein [Defluviicoccus sp.]MDE0274454.1 hypothetical protein [Defluviicoccus sp.]